MPTPCHTAAEHASSGGSFFSCERNDTHTLPSMSRILASYFPDIQSLLQYLESRLSFWTRQALDRAACAFLQSVLIHDPSQTCLAFDASVHCSLNEILHRAIALCVERKTKHAMTNVLSLGYRPVSRSNRLALRRMKGAHPI